LEALSDSQPDSSSDPTSCNVFPLVLSSFKDQQCFADIDTPAQPSVRGRLRKCIDFWRSLEVSQFILNVIIQGYKIPFFHLPTPFSKANNTSARNNSAFVSEPVNDLLKLLVSIYHAFAQFFVTLGVVLARPSQNKLIWFSDAVLLFVVKWRQNCVLQLSPSKKT